MIFPSIPLPSVEEWAPFYALFPTRLLDGRWAWLHRVERRWVDGVWGAGGRWEYREPGTA